ncbi:putative Long-chain-fatty-acid--AMP ligase FadD32 [Azospirillaceae bacterium]
MIGDGFLGRFEAHVVEYPDKVAFIFLGDGERESARLHYGELRERALTLADHLAVRCPVGERALLMFPFGPDFIIAFLACLYSGVIAVPVHLPHPRRRDIRIGGIVADCAPRMVLTNRATRSRLAERLAQDAGLGNDHYLAIDDLPETVQRRRFTPTTEIDPNQIAFLQYTSGSTLSPRGVCVTHAMLAVNQAMIQEKMGTHRGTVYVSWLPTHHDMGLIGDTLNPLWCGGYAVKLPPAAFIQHPRRWLLATSNWGGTIIGGPNFAFDLCRHRISAEQWREFDLRSLEICYCGAEPIRVETIAGFLSVAEAAGFQPETFGTCYGLAEATLFVVGRKGLRTLAVASDHFHNHRISSPDVDAEALSLVSSGFPTAACDVAIVDPESARRAPPDCVGEIWVSGEHVAQRYWTWTEAGQTVFDGRLDDGRRYLRTGDLGFIHDGELFVTGRIKDLIIIRGRNIYPQDLEHVAQAAHPVLRACSGAAFAIERDGQEDVCLVHESLRIAGREQRAEAQDAVRRAIVEMFEIPVRDVIVVPPGRLPMTTSGKVQRSKSREWYLSGKFVDSANVGEV